MIATIFDIESGEGLLWTTTPTLDVVALEAGQAVIEGRHDFEATLFAWDAQAGEATAYPRPQADLDARRVTRAKKDARRAAARSYRRYEAALTAGIPEGERLSWAQKEAAARAVLTAGRAPSAEGLALLDAELAVTQPAGLDVDRDALEAAVALLSELGGE